MSAAGKGGLVWGKARLADFLRGPKAKVKGTWMASPGLRSDDEIRDVIAYLEQQAGS